MCTRLSSVVITAALATLLCGAEPEGRVVRVGTYDSRAVALAYGRSAEHNERIKQLHVDHQQAVEAKNEARIKALEQEANDRQHRLHMQVFGNAPILDIVAFLDADLRECARQETLDLIVREVDIAHRGAAVEVVDITDRLVKRFRPSDETLKIMSDLKSHAPLPLERFPIECGEDAGGTEAKDDPAAGEAAQAEAGAWMRLLDGGRYAESWRQASEHFRSVVPEKVWIDRITALRASLGAVSTADSRKLLVVKHLASLPDAPPGRYIMLLFKTPFAEKNGATESVTCVLEKDGAWKVDGYYVR